MGNRMLSVGGLIIAAVLFIAINIVADKTLRASRLDLTQAQLIGLFSPQYRVATLGLSAATLLTPLAYWYSHRRRLRLGVGFIFAQALLDVFLVNGIVHLTGGSSSYFTFLFIPLAAVYALILPLLPAVPGTAQSRKRLAQSGCARSHPGSVRSALHEWAGDPAIRGLGLKVLPGGMRPRR